MQVGLSYQYSFKSLLETLKVLSDYVDEQTIKKSAFFDTMINIVNKESILLVEVENRKKQNQINQLDIEK